MDLLNRDVRLSRATRALGLVVLSLVMSVAVWSGAIAVSPLTQGGDGQYFHRVMEIAKVAVLRYHELPIWNPFECGGVPLWDNPEMPVASPLVYLTLPLSGTRTMWVWFILHTAAGFASMWLFSRRELRLTRVAAFASASLWALGVGHLTQYGGGHATLCNFYLFPLVLLLFRRSERNLDCAVGLGLVFAYMFLEGSAYPLVHSSLLLACEAVIRLASAPREMLGRALRIARGAVATGIVTLLVTASRLLPVLDQVSRHKRGLGEETDAITRETLFAMFFDRSHGWTVPGQMYVWPEFTSYFGWMTMLLFVVGVLFATKKFPWFTLLGVIAFSFMMGHFASWAPWHVLKGHVFPFSSMRVPSRFRLFVACFIAGFVGLAVDHVPLALRRFGAAPAQIARVLTIGFAMFAAGDVYSVSHEIIAQKYVAAPTTIVKPSPRLFLEGPGLAPFLDQPRQNRGRLACADSWPYTEGAPVWMGDVPQARALDPEGSVTASKRTPSTFTVDVDARAPTRIAINTPFELGWRTSVGRAVDQNKLLVVELPAGQHHVKVEYWPRGMTIGLVLSFVGLVLAIGFLTRSLWRRAGIRSRAARGTSHRPARHDRTSVRGPRPRGR